MQEEAKRKTMSLAQKSAEDRFKAIQKARAKKNWAHFREEGWRKKLKPYFQEKGW